MDECDGVLFFGIREHIRTPLVMIYPNVYEAFIVKMDALEYCLGALLQGNDENGKLDQLRYARRLMSGAEKSYSMSVKGALTVVLI